MAVYKVCWFVAFTRTVWVCTSKSVIGIVANPHLGWKIGSGSFGMCN